MSSSSKQLINGLNTIYYRHRDKVIMLAAGATFVYYTIAIVREFVHLMDETKLKYNESCQNIQYIHDYIFVLKRCEKCNRTYKYQKAYQKHLQKHDYQDQFDKIMMGIN